MPNIIRYLGIVSARELKPIERVLPEQEEVTKLAVESLENVFASTSPNDLAPAPEKTMSLASKPRALPITQNADASIVSTTPPAETAPSAPTIPAQALPTHPKETAAVSLLASASPALVSAPVKIASKPAEPKRKELQSTNVVTSAPTRPKFFRENGGLLAALLVAAVAAVFCFFNWVRSFLWPRQNRPFIPGAAFALEPLQENDSPQNVSPENESMEGDTGLTPVNLPLDLPVELPPFRKPRRLDPLVISQTAR